jgi:L-threonylcarbamoyladenylate synthase
MIYGEDIRNSLNVLRSGGVILYPTDTIWGLGCDATISSAVEKIFKIKSRSETMSLIILVNGESMVERYVKYIPEIAFQITGVSEKPVTIIYPGGKNLAPGICSEDGSVGIRICRDPFCNELITRFRKPIVSTSANLSGRPSPAHFGEIDEEIINNADYVVEHRQEDRQKHSASPVIKIEGNGVFKILRM